MARAPRVAPAARRRRAALQDAEPVRIGVAFDDAFCFYYPENLELLEDAGAEIVTFSPLEDDALPRDLGLIYIGGGISEAFVPRLAGNQSFLESLRRAHAHGVPVYAEGCGLQYSRAHRCAPATVRPHQMAGLVPDRHRARGGHAAQRLSRPQHRDVVDARSGRDAAARPRVPLQPAAVRAATASTPRTRCTTATASRSAARAGPIRSCSRRSSTCISARNRSSPAGSSPTARESLALAERTRR